MPNRLVARLAILLLAMLIMPSMALAALPTNAEVEAILNKHLIANNKAKGVAVALVDANGIRVVTAGMSRPGEVVKPDDLFEIGSVTKTFTGLLLAVTDSKAGSFVLEQRGSKLTARRMP